MDSTFVAMPTDPSFNQQTAHFQWDERLSVQVPTQPGQYGAPVGNPTLTASGNITSTYDPSDAADDCTGQYSAIPGPPWPEPPQPNVPPFGLSSSGGFGQPVVINATTTLPFANNWVSSTGPPGSDCAVTGAEPIPHNDNGPDYSLTSEEDIALTSLPVINKIDQTFVSSDGRQTDHIVATYSLTATALCSSGSGADDMSAPGIGDPGAATDVATPGGAGLGTTAIARAAGAGLTVTAGPNRRIVGDEHFFTFTANAAGGCHPYTFEWQLQPRQTKKKLKNGKFTVPTDGYGNITPASATQHGTASKLKIKMQCVLPRKVRKNSPESWRPCWGDVRYKVTATDSPHVRTGFAYAVFNWQPECTSKARKDVAREKIKNLASDILDEIPKHVADEITTKGVELLLEAETLGPYLLQHGIAHLGVDILTQILEANRAEADVKLPNC